MDEFDDDPETDYFPPEDEDEPRDRPSVTQHHTTETSQNDIAVTAHSPTQAIFVSPSPVTPSEIVQRPSGVTQRPPEVVMHPAEVTVIPVTKATSIKSTNVPKQRKTTEQSKSATSPSVIRPETATSRRATQSNVTQRPTERAITPETTTMKSLNTAKEDQPVATYDYTSTIRPEVFDDQETSDKPLFSLPDVSAHFRSLREHYQLPPVTEAIVFAGACFTFYVILLTLLYCVARRNRRRRPRNSDDIEMNPRGASTEPKAGTSGQNSTNCSSKTTEDSPQTDQMVSVNITDGPSPNNPTTGNETLVKQLAYSPKQPKKGSVVITATVHNSMKTPPNEPTSDKVRPPVKASKEPSVRECKEPEVAVLETTMSTSQMKVGSNATSVSKALPKEINKPDSGAQQSQSTSHGNTANKSTGLRMKRTAPMIPQTDRQTRSTTQAQNIARKEAKDKPRWRN